MSPPVAPALPGETLGDGKYRVERIIGQGGMGIVVAAKHVELDERVAIKFLLGEPSTAAVERFLREARAAVKVKGEHVCRVLDFGRLESGEPYIVMEYLEGTDLSKLVERSGAQKSTAAVGWIIEACDALAEAHSLGIVHRDIKPANIFLAKRGDGTTVAKVLDFGISKLPSQAGQITGTQTSMGSPAYMSPEQMESARDVDGRTDIWSLGVTLHELLSGKPPFIADSLLQLTVLVREKEPPALEGVPSDLAEVVRKCLAKDPKDRYQTIGGLVADLEPFAPEEVIGLVRRLARRDSHASSAVALAATAPERRSDAERLENVRVRDDDDADPALTESGVGEHREKDVGVGKGTFAPLQSTLDRSSSGGETKRRAWTRLAVAAGVVGALALGGAYLSRSHDPPASPPSPPSASPEAAASIKEEPSTRLADAPPSSRQPPLVPSSELPPSKPTAVSPAPSPTASAFATVTAAKTAATTVPADAGPPSVVATASLASGATAPSATATKPEPKKRRDLDRDDP